MASVFIVAGMGATLEEIDAERQVIQREWRARNTGSQRILEKLLPVMMQGSRYGQRFPIGSMEIIKISIPIAYMVPLLSGTVSRCIALLSDK